MNELIELNQKGDFNFAGSVERKEQLQYLPEYKDVWLQLKDVIHSLCYHYSLK